MSSERIQFLGTHGTCRRARLVSRKYVLHANACTELNGGSRVRVVGVSDHLSSLGTAIFC